MTRTDDLMATMQRHMRGTAFLFTRTAKGFDIDVDIANHQWWGVLAETGLSETSSFQVTTDELDNKYTIVETPRHITWVDDMPRFAPRGGGAPKQRMNDQVDLRVSAEPIRRLIRREAEGVGFREMLDNRKLLTMLGVALGGVVAVVVVIVVIVNSFGG